MKSSKSPVRMLRDRSNNTITRLRTGHFSGWEIDRNGRRTYWNFDNCPNTELTPAHIFDCPAILIALQEMGALFLSTHLYEDNIEQIARIEICAYNVCCQVIYSQFGLAIHQNDHQAKRRFVEWAKNEIAVVPDFHKRILFSDEAHFWLNGYVNKQNCRIWSEANPQVYVETPLHPEKLTVWCALWTGGILLQKR
ncbi:DUF4817 domain-containing protein [Trichonephila clavipes]|nr:DUF4817 domain-containing protein [Trichonephila clavipes]